MKKFLTKNKKYLGLILIAAIVFNFVFLPLTALAQSTPASAAATPAASTPKPADVSWVGQVISWVSGESLLFASSAISMIFGALFGVVLWLEAQIIDYIIISPANFSFTSSPIVTLGWGITRDLANMFFILILLVIAFATVFRVQTYSIKQLWWQILAAAVLINFSLVIAGFVIDFTQILTTFFLNQITGGGSFGTITTRLAASMQILNFYNPATPASMGQGIVQFGASGIAAVVGIILTLVGLVVTVFVFGALAVFLIVRILYIWFLLIVAPFIWMLWVLPATQKYFSQWWDEFIRWTFFATIYVFMIYLSLSIFDAAGKFSPGVFPTAGSPYWNTATPGLTTVGMPAAIFQWILVIAMMFGSLIVAKQFGAEGAVGARKILTGWGTDTKNWAGRQLRRQALGVGAKEAAPGVAARPGLLVRGAQKLAAIPGGRWLAGPILKMTAAEAGTVKTAQEQFAKWTSQGIQEYLKRPPGPITNALFRNQQMGAALALKEKGDLDELNVARIIELATLASREYSKQELREILKVAPHLAPGFNEDMKKTVGRIEKADQIILSSLANSDVVINLNPNQLKDIVQKADDAKVQRVKSVVESEFSRLPGTMPTDIDRILSIPNNNTRNRTLNAFMSQQLAAGVPREEVQRYEKIARSRATTNSPAWAI